MIYNCDCVAGAKEHLADESIHLMVCDPPFGIGETSFHRHYNRDETHVLPGYVEAPDDYYKFSFDWLTQAKRVMKPDASMYVISGWSNLRHILNAIHDVGFYEINHLIWKFNFGIATRAKYVSSHYHILFLKKEKDVKHKFNLHCRFGSQERSETGKSLLYQDLDDVFVINKEYHPGETKNKNKLPDALIEKLVLYSSDEGDTVCDFFQGNFTTAFVSKRLGRVPMGFELNKDSFEYYMPRLDAVRSGERLDTLKKVVDESPPNQGKPISQEERLSIYQDYTRSTGKKKDIIASLCTKYGRGRFSIKNVIDSFSDKTLAS